MGINTIDVFSPSGARAMLLHISGLFSTEEVQRIREALEQTEWADGKLTAGYQSAKAKHNLQLPEATRWPRRSARR